MALIREYRFENEKSFHTSSKKVKDLIIHIKSSSKGRTEIDKIKFYEYINLLYQNKKILHFDSENANQYVLFCSVELRGIKDIRLRKMSG